MVHVDVLYQGVTDQNLTLSIISFFLSLLVLCSPCCLLVPDVPGACSVACINFTIQLLHVFVVLLVFFSLCHFFYLAMSKQRQVCRTFYFSQCISALVVLSLLQIRP